jgi:hypothetical protein
MKYYLKEQKWKFSHYKFSPVKDLSQKLTLLKIFFYDIL